MLFHLQWILNRILDEFSLEIMEASQPPHLNKCPSIVLHMHLEIHVLQNETVGFVHLNLHII